jgi:hypothetical protein
MNTYSMLATINQTNMTIINLLIFGSMGWNCMAMY